MGIEDSKLERDFSIPFNRICEALSIKKRYTQKITSKGLWQLFITDALPLIWSDLEEYMAFFGYQDYISHFVKEKPGINPTYLEYLLLCVLHGWGHDISMKRKSSRRSLAFWLVSQEVDLFSRNLALVQGTNAWVPKIQPYV